MAGTTIFTIGHSNHPLAWFIGLLTRHGIGVLADVRSRPLSRFVPHFNRERLRASVEDAGIAYRYHGHALGGRSDDPACQRDGRMDDELAAATPRFRQGLHEVRGEAATRRLCLMCAERDPLDCHRALLVGVRLRSADVALVHILADGTLEPHERSEARLLARHRLDQPELFRGEAERLAEAYRSALGRRRAGLRPPVG